MARTGFMFAGQGAQFPGMGRKVAESSKAAQDIFEKADRMLGYSISNLCFDGTIEDLTPCAVCQPAIFTVSMACITSFAESQESTPPSVAGGLSLGEFSAACTAGVFSFEDALGLVALRGKLMDKCCKEFPGGMIAVLGAEPAAIQQVCEEAGIDVANFNCPGQIVISGENAGLDKASKALEAMGIRAIRLTVAGAYHSRLMASAAEAFGKALASVEANKPLLPFVQNVTGAFAATPAEIKDNLQRQIFSSVRWEQCVRTMMGDCEALAEFGPGNVLSGFMRRIDRKFPAAPAFAEI